MSVINVKDETSVNYLINPTYAINDSSENIYLLDNTTNQKFNKVMPASTKNHKYLNWNLEVNKNHMLDKHVKIVFPKVKFTFRGSFNPTNPDQTGYSTGSDAYTDANFFKDICLKPGGLLNCTSGIELVVNGTAVRSSRIEMSEVVHALLSQAEKSDTLSSGVYSGSMDLVQNYSDYKVNAHYEPVKMKHGGTGFLSRNSNSVSPFIEAGTVDYSANSRRFNVSEIKVGLTDMSFVIENLEMAILLSPFSFTNSKDRDVIRGIEKMNVTLSIDQTISKMFGIRKTNVNTEFSNLVTSIADIELVEAPNLHLTEIVLPEWELIEAQKRGYPAPYSLSFPSMTTLHNSIIKSSEFGSAHNIETQSLDVIPENIYICVLKRRMFDGSGLDIDFAHCPRVSARCRDLTVRYNLTQTTFQMEDITAMTLRNGIRNYTKDELDYLVGSASVIKINVAKDLSSGNTMFVGQKFSGKINLSMTLENLDLKDTTNSAEYGIYVFAETNRILSYKEGVFTVGEFLATTNLGDISADNLIKADAIIRNSDPIVFGGGLYGAGIWDSIKNFGSRVIKNIPGIVNAVRDGVNLYRSLRGGAKPSGSTVIGGCEMRKSTKSKSRLGGASIDKLTGF